MATGLDISTVQSTTFLLATRKFDYGFLSTALITAMLGKERVANTDATDQTCNDIPLNHAGNESFRPMALQQKVQ